MSQITFHKFHHLPVFTKMMPFRATFGEFVCGFSLATTNKITLIENRGLHWTDKKLDLDFVGRHPNCSLEDIYDLYLSGHLTDVLKQRNPKSTRITPREYLRNLRVRNIRGQILNPALRKDQIFLSRGELLRKSALNPFAKKFIAMASDTTHASFVQNWALVG